MGQYLVPICVVLLSFIQSLAANVLIHTSDTIDYQPMVAFLCNKPSMYRVPNGWIQDNTQNCTKNGDEILTFCKKKYPDHDITNVVHHHKAITINTWCKVGTDHCHRHNSHSVVPYRCIVGVFQSRALLVPEHCVFDHYHTSECANEEHWNNTATTRCESKGLVKQSYDILLPCPATEEFQGVEYVCCPKSQQPKVTIDVHVKHPHVAPEIALPKPSEGPQLVDEPERPYFRYIHDHQDKTLEEHENYEIARRDWVRYHHDKITGMMKDWSAARDRVVQLKATDPVRAEKINQEIGEKFQKLYHSLEEEGIAEKTQLNTLHQNHVQKKFNELKRDTMKAFMDALQRDQPKASELLSTIERYIRVEEKDRRHTVNHYEHMLDTDQLEADRILPSTIDHLTWIEKRITQSIQMLHRFPDLEAQLKPEIEKILRRYAGIAASASMIISPHIEDEQRVAVEEQISHEKETTVQPIEETPKYATTPFPRGTEVPDLVIEDVIVKDEKVKDAEKPKEAFDPETNENEHQYFDKEGRPYVVHQTDSRMHQDTLSVHKEAVQTGGVYGATVGIAIGSVSVFAVIIVAILMMKKRARKPQITHGFVEVDQAVSPEERHVANMQINGYENPTYRYFEK